MPVGESDMNTDAPIILGGPPMDMPAEEPQYLGDINEAPMIGDQPILLMPTDGSGDDMMMMMMEQPSALSESAEPSPMQKWNAEWQATLIARKDAENARRAELVEKARADLEKFQAEREAKREARMVTNRSDEQAKLEAIEADLENDNSWQRVCKMVELSHDNKADAKDVKRMRDIFIFLKNEPTRAAALTN